MKKKNILKNRDGFTLVEIIAALVIVGILAAVAVPKYIDLIDEANNKAVEGALAAGTSEVAMNYAKSLLTEVTTDDSLTDVAAACNTDLGDFTASYAVTDAGTGIDVTITAPASIIDDVAAADLTKEVVLE